MKSILITYNQALTEKIEYMFNTLEIRGYTRFDEVKGRGSVDGEPKMGTHTWPEINNAIITVVDDEKVSAILEKISTLNEINTDLGIRAFVWNIEQSV